MNAQKTQVATLTRDLEGMRAEVDRIRQRSKIQALVKLYELKLAVVEATLRAEEHQKLQVDVDNVNSRINTEREKIAPLEVISLHSMGNH